MLTLNFKPVGLALLASDWLVDTERSKASSLIIFPLGVGDTHGKHWLSYVLLLLRNNVRRANLTRP
jgi:hypothetical protein